MIRSPRIDSDFFRLRNPPPPVAPQNVEWCCIWDSVQSVEQPWPAEAMKIPTSAPNLTPNFCFYFLRSFDGVAELFDYLDSDWSHARPAILETCGCLLNRLHAAAARDLASIPWSVDLVQDVAAGRWHRYQSRHCTCPG